MIQFRKILCPVDFFPGSLRAFEYALKLAKEYGSEILALHVISPVTPVYEAAMAVPDMTAELEKSAERKLIHLKTKAAKAGVSMKNVIKHGDVDVEIRRALKPRGTDLVVMGTHGRRGFERWFLGSVTERLMRHSSVPLLIIGGPTTARTVPPSIGSILVTTDFSDGTTDAMSYAFSLAEECQAKINVLHVMDDTGMSGAPPNFRESAMASLREKLEAFVPGEARVWCDVTTTVTTGKPYQVILKTLKRDKVGLLVMNVHGKGMWERALVGSTAERVVRAAECPVMLIPSMKPASKAAPRKKKGRAA